VAESWGRDEFTVYGRFDLAYDGRNPPRMLEYNADTPTALLEAAVIQWFWLKDVYPQADQFNSIHERLIEAWKMWKRVGVERLHFTSLAGNIEDYMTVNYLRDTAMQAGYDTHYLEVESIGWNPASGGFVDEQDRPLRQVFKLYPWEWMLREQFGPNLKTAITRWLEPPWKMILSNKAILPILYGLFPESPYLLEASFEPLDGACVRKPLYSREGANVALMENGRLLMETEGDYEAPFVYQRRYPLPQFDGNYPVIGSWMVNGYACGMGIREDASPVTQNTSRFVPHLFE
jgi:glutathionylspermidine synthase